MKKMTWIVVALVSMSINLASAQSADVAEMIREAERVLGEVQVEENAVEVNAEQAAPAAAASSCSCSSSGESNRSGC